MISSKKLNIVDKVKSFNENDIIKDLRKPKDIALIKDGKTDFYIYVDKAEDSCVIEAADFLKDTLNNMVSGKIFDIINEYDVSRKLIVLKTLNSADNIKDDGYIIKTCDGNINISGICGSGTANGIYAFLEDVLGCMFVRSDFDYIPKTDTAYIDEINILKNHDFKWRCIYQYEVFSTDWYKKIQSNGTNDKAWGSTCHTIFEYVNPDLYFENHPEYYSLRWGKRKADQLCLSNPDIYPIISKRLNEMIENNPQALYWDFSINDNLHYCQCKQCRKLYSKYGKSGSMLLILNKLAKEHPDKIISTLAYTYNEKPPKNLQLEPNINISLAPIKSGQKYSFLFSGSKKAKKTHDLIESWGKILKNVYIWDYIVNFQHVLLPYPNFDVQRDNLRFYKENNVKMVFHQGMRDPCCELADLRSYIMARQLRDIDCDIDSLMTKYLCVTYKKAAIYVAEYLQYMNELMRSKAKDLDLYDKPKQHRRDYLSTDAIKHYEKLIDMAFEAEKDDPEVLYRLEEIKINVLYAKITEASFDKEGKRRAAIELKELYPKHNINRYNEWDKPTLTELINKYI